MREPIELSMSEGLEQELEDAVAGHDEPTPEMQQLIDDVVSGKAKVKTYDTKESFFKSLGI